MAQLNQVHGLKKFVGTDFVKTVAVTVTTGQTVGASAADSTLVSGVILGYYPTSNQDQLVDSVALAATTGVVTITLAAAATASNVFAVTVLKGKNA
jgi:hypothetical protein